MPNLVVDLSKVALILWSGMLIISGSIWILSSQVRRLGDLLERQSTATTRASRPARPARVYASVSSSAAVTLRHAAPVPGRVTQTVAAR